MIVAGIDPGLVRTGYAFIRAGAAGRLEVCEAGVLSLGRGGPVPARLKLLYEQVRDLLQEFRPDEIAVESLYSQYRHPQTAILMGHARGVVLLAAALAGVAVTAYAPAQIKKSITGNGRATKQQMERMVQALLGLPQPPHPSDAADALAAAICHANAILHGTPGAAMVR